jgi:TolB-like protein
VLPFANMSGDAEQEYFSEGITEDIITNLSRNRAFFVISRSTSFTYKGPAVDVAKVGAELGVRYVVEGSVRRAGKRVRITAQLIDAETGHHLWADRYDRDLSDVFGVQDEIAQSITGAIAPGIISAEIRHAQQKDPNQLDAWDRIMRAHWHIRRFTQGDLAEARRLLTEAIGLDPTNSMAFSDIAFLRHFQACFGWGENAAEVHASAGEAARKAVSLDEGRRHGPHGPGDLRDVLAPARRGQAPVAAGDRSRSQLRLRAWLYRRQPRLCRRDRRGAAASRRRDPSEPAGSAADHLAFGQGLGGAGRRTLREGD